MRADPTGCPAVEELKAWLDGELARAAGSRLEAHVSDCAACKEEVEAMRRIGVGLRALGSAVEPPAALRERVLAAIEFPQRPAVRMGLFRLLRWGAAAGLVALAVWVLLPGFTPGRLAMRMGADAPTSVVGGHTSVAGASGGPPAAPAASPPFGGELLRKASAASNLKQLALGMLMYSQDYDQGVNGDPYPQFGPTGVTPDDVRRYARGAAVEDPRRKVSQTAELSVSVARKVETVQDEVLDRIKRDGGYAEESTLSAPAGGDRVANLTLRVPVEKFEATLRYLSGLGELRQKDVHGEDVTGTWVDQRSEVRRLRAEEDRLATALREEEARLAARPRSTSSDRKNALQAQLNGVQSRIPSAEESFAATGKLAALATVRATLTEAAHTPAGGSLLWEIEDTARGALAAFLVALRIPLGLLIWLAVFAPLWVPLVLVFRWAGKQVRPLRHQDLMPEPRC